MKKLSVNEQQKLYKKIIDSLKSCEEEDDCSKCEQIGECIHYIRKCLVLVFQSHIIRLQENKKKYKGIEEINKRKEKEKKGYFT